jgi:hypothetical protein
MASRQSRQPSPDTAIARMLAVAALAVATIVFLIVIAGSGGDDGGAEEPRRTATTSAPRSGEEYYVIEPDDTFLGIAEEVGLSQAELERLNPNLDTQILPVQGCVNLVPDGCKALAGN